MNDPKFYLGGNLFGYSLNRDEALQLLDRAYVGGSFGIDTAGTYVAGNSEKIIGDWISTRGVINKIRIATKLETNFTDFGAGLNKYLEKQLSSSLFRLKSSSIDTVLLHHFIDDGKFVDIFLDFFKDNLINGQIQNWGICNINTKQFEFVAKAMTNFNLRTITIQNYCNWAKRKYDYWNSFFDIASSNGIQLKVISYGVYGRGVLVSKHSEETTLIKFGKPRDYLNSTVLKEKQLIPMQEILLIIKDFIPTSNDSLARFALSFIANQNSGAVVGIRTFEQLASANAAYSELFTESLILEAIQKVNSRLGRLNLSIGDTGLGV